MTGGQTALGNLDRIIAGLSGAAAREAARRDAARGGNRGPVNKARWAILRGRTAKVHGQPPEQNPYPAGGAEAFCWAAGHAGRVIRPARARNVTRETSGSAPVKVGRGRAVSGLPRREWSVLEETVMRLCTGGSEALSDAEIGALLDRPGQAVRSHRHKLAKAERTS